MRLNLADLTSGLPAGATLRLVTAINNRGNMIGFGSAGSYLLELAADCDAP